MVLVAWVLRVDVDWSVEVAELMAIRKGLRILARLIQRVGLTESDALQLFMNLMRNIHSLL